MLNFRSIDPLIELALTEDIGIGDITTESTVQPSQRGVGTIIAKSSGVIAGLPVTQRVFEKVDLSLDFRLQVSDGEQVQSMTPIAEVEGAVQSILIGERTALNFLQRLSGTTTLTAQFVTAAAKYDAKLSTHAKRPPVGGSFRSMLFASVADTTIVLGSTTVC